MAAVKTPEMTRLRACGEAGTLAGPWAGELVPLLRKTQAAVHEAESRAGT